MSKLLVALCLVGIAALAVQAIESDNIVYRNYGNKDSYGRYGKDYKKSSSSSSSEEDKVKLLCTTNASFNFVLDGNPSAFSCKGKTDPIECEACCTGFAFSKGWAKDSILSTVQGTECICCRSKSKK